MTTINTIGRVTKDVELKKTKDGSNVFVNLSVAVNEGFGDKQRTIYYSVIIFGADAERLIKAKVKKGSLLNISGRFSLSEYTKKDGTLSYSLNITDALWSYVPGAASQSKDSSNNENGSSQASSVSSSAEHSFEEVDLDDDELPF